MIVSAFRTETVFAFLLGVLAMYLVWGLTNSKEKHVAERVVTSEKQNAHPKNYAPAVGDGRAAVIENGTRIAIPAKFRFGNIADVDKSIRNFDDLLSRYAPAQQEILIRYYASYGAEAMRFESEAQWQWMVERGFPLPDEILTAAELDDDSLGKSAVQGNVKAAYFWFDRFLSEPHPDPTTAEGMARAGEFLRYGVEAQSTMLASGSPFAGYVYQLNEEWRHPGVPSAMGYAIAQLFGDSRAGEKIPLDIISYNSVVWTILQSNPNAHGISADGYRRPFPEADNAR